MNNFLNIKNKNYTRNCLLIICIVGAFLRISHCGTRTKMDRDAILYAQAAETWTSETSSEDEKAQAFEVPGDLPPLLVTTLAFGELIGINSQFFGVFIGISLGLLLVIAIYHISFIITNDKKLALIAAFLASIHPNLIILSCSGIRDTLYIPMICFATLSAMFAIQKNKLYYWGMFAIFAVLGLLSRTEGMEILFFYFLWIPIYLVKNRNNLKDCLPVVFKSLAVVLITYSLFLTIVVSCYKNTYYENWQPLKTQRAINTIKSFFIKSKTETLNKDA